MFLPFAIRWPRYARLEAAILFPVMVIVAKQMPTVRSFAAAIPSFVYTSPTGWTQLVIGWIKLILVTAIPYCVLLLLISGVMGIRKGYALLALLAVASWAAATFLLWPTIARYSPVTLSASSAAYFAAGFALLVHMRPLIIGLRDRGFVRMRLMANHNEAMAWRKPALLSRGVISVEQPWVAPNPRGRKTGAARSAARQVVPIGLILALVYNAYVYRNLIAQSLRAFTSSTASMSSEPSVPNEATSVRGSDGRFVFDATANGEELQVVYDPSASFLTLNSETADRLGLSYSNRAFSTSTRTAFGFIEVAPTMIDTMTIGKITMTHLTAYVSKPGQLTQNILGQSFLQRLASDTVTEDKLILKGR